MLTRLTLDGQGRASCWGQESDTLLEEDPARQVKRGLDLTISRPCVILNRT